MTSQSTPLDHCSGSGTRMPLFESSVIYVIIIISLVDASLSNPIHVGQPMTISCNADQVKFRFSNLFICKHEVGNLAEFVTGLTIPCTINLQEKQKKSDTQICRTCSTASSFLKHLLLRKLMSSNPALNMMVGG